MTIEEARQQLIHKRRKKSILQKEINELRDFLKEKGISDVTHISDQTERNRQIYIKKMQGLSLKGIAEEYSVSPPVITNVVNVISRKLNLKDHTKYADLLQYGEPPIKKSRMKSQK